MSETHGFNIMSIADNYSDILKSVALSENVLNPEIGFPQETKKGDNFVGKMCFIEINGTEKSLSVALKTAPDNEELRRKMRIETIFRNEVMFYTEINKIFQKIQGFVKNPFVAPKCYHASLERGKEHLILEDLNEAGYLMWDRRITMDREHVIFVFKQYAKLHALSYVLKQTDVESFNFIQGNVVNLMEETYWKNEESNEACRRILLKIIDASPEVFKNNEITAKFNDFIQNFPKIFIESCEANKDNVFCHGDCWCNNMLFKYEDGNLIDMKLIDFQLVKIGNPVLDLSYFLYACTSRNIYGDIDGLLHIYFEALMEHAKYLGVEITLTFEELKNYWRLYGKFGLLMASLAIKAMLADGDDDTPDILKSVDEGRQVFDGFNYAGKNDKEYYRRLTDVILHCHENGFL